MFLKKFLLFGLFAAILPAFAEEAADRKTATSLKYVEHELDTRQNKFTAEQNKAMEYTDSAGIVQQRTVKSDLGTSTTDTSLPMVGGVNTKLATKQDDIAAVNDHTAVTYTGQPGGIGRKGIYQTTESYAAQSDNLIDAKTFNAAIKNGLDSEFKCKEFKPGTDLCWVYSIHNATEDNTLLPTGYIPLEYIRSNGTQYIDTELKANLNTKVEFDMRFPAYTNNLLGYIMGARTTQNTNAFLIGSNDASISANSYFFAQFDNVISTVVQKKYFDLQKHSLKLSSDGFYIDDVLYSSFANPQNFITRENIVLFARYSEGTLAKGALDLYSFKIWNGNELVRNMIPAQYGTTVGMYDTVEGRFFTSVPANTNFAAGPEISTNNIYIPQNQ